MSEVLVIATSDIKNSAFIIRNGDNTGYILPLAAADRKVDHNHLPNNYVFMELPNGSPAPIRDGITLIKMASIADDFITRHHVTTTEEGDLLHWQLWAETVEERKNVIMLMHQQRLFDIAAPEQNFIFDPLRLEWHGERDRTILREHHIGLMSKLVSIPCMAYDLPALFKDVIEESDENNLPIADITIVILRNTPIDA